MIVITKRLLTLITPTLGKLLEIWKIHIYFMSTCSPNAKTLGITALSLSRMLSFPLNLLFSVRLFFYSLSFFLHFFPKNVEFLVTFSVSCLLPFSFFIFLVLSLSFFFFLYLSFPFFIFLFLSLFFFFFHFSNFLRPFI